jgi:hypothetical protein
MQRCRAGDFMGGIVRDAAFSQECQPVVRAMFDVPTYLTVAVFKMWRIVVE